MIYDYIIFIIIALVFPLYVIFSGKPFWICILVAWFSLVICSVASQFILPLLIHDRSELGRLTAQTAFVPSLLLGWMYGLGVYILGMLIKIGYRGLKSKRSRGRKGDILL